MIKGARSVEIVEQPALTFCDFSVYHFASPGILLVWMILYEAKAHFYSQLFSIEHTLTYTWQHTIGSKSVGKHLLVVVIQQRLICKSSRSQQTSTSWTRKCTLFLIGMHFCWCHSARIAMHVQEQCWVVSPRWAYPPVYFEMLHRCSSN